ncbi:MAG: hypothetical protein R3F45_08025 [Gammaproteobacteria bacterium]
MTTRRALLAIAVALWTAMFSVPFLAASATCDGRLSAYFYAGVAVLLGVTIMPFLLRGGGIVSSCPGSALILAVATLAVWVAGLYAADVRIICRLF